MPFAALPGLAVVLVLLWTAFSSLPASAYANAVAC
jgi:hypothetical protein